MDGGAGSAAVPIPCSEDGDGEDTTGAYRYFVDTYLVPVLGSVVSAAGSGGTWRRLKVSVLYLCREKASRRRLAALHTIEELCVSAKENYLELLPETVPFLSELLEDENHEVEAQCQALIRRIEEVTGESLQEYLQ